MPYNLKPQKVNGIAKLSLAYPLTLFPSSAEIVRLCFSWYN